MTHSLQNEKLATDWPHSPPHMFDHKGFYMVTAATYQKQRLFNTPEKLAYLHSSLLGVAEHYNWQLMSWAVFSNHYHFVGANNTCPQSLPDFISMLHRQVATGLNRMDRTPGRMVWYRYWDTALTYNASYMARLRYVNENPVKHGLVADARQYTWCSAAWFEEMATKEFHRSVQRFKTDRLNIADDF